MTTGTNRQPPPSGSAIRRPWGRVPLVIRAVLAGLAVFVIGGAMGWQAILALVPAPWFAPVMAGVLWVCWQYFSENWPADEGAAARRANFRATSLGSEVWKWSVAAALLGVAAFQTNIFNFSYWWSDVAEVFGGRPIAETGLDFGFGAGSFACAASFLRFIWAVRRTRQARQAAGRFAALAR